MQYVASPITETTLELIVNLINGGSCEMLNASIEIYGNEFFICFTHFEKDLGRGYAEKIAITFKKL